MGRDIWLAYFVVAVVTALWRNIKGCSDRFIRCLSGSHGNSSHYAQTRSVVFKLDNDSISRTNHIIILTIFIAGSTEIWMWCSSHILSGLSVGFLFCFFY